MMAFGKEDETAVKERARLLKQKINEAWDDPRPSLPATDVFEEILRGEGQGDRK